jgi:hypothetical protein
LVGVGVSIGFSFCFWGSWSAKLPLDFGHPVKVRMAGNIAEAVSGILNYMCIWRCNFADERDPTVSGMPALRKDGGPELGLPLIHVSKQGILAVLVAHRGYQGPPGVVIAGVVRTHPPLEMGYQRVPLGVVFPAPSSCVRRQFCEVGELLNLAIGQDRPNRPIFLLVKEDRAAGWYWCGTHGSHLKLLRIQKKTLGSAFPAFTCRKL